MKLFKTTHLYILGCAVAFSASAFAAPSATGKRPQVRANASPCPLCSPTPLPSVSPSPCPSASPSPSASPTPTVSPTPSGSPSPAPIACAQGLPAISTSQTYFSFLVLNNNAITPITPSLSNTAFITVTPALPAGLSLDPGTGIISGTPTGNSIGLYTLNAYNSCGQSGTETINIQTTIPVLPQ